MCHLTVIPAAAGLKEYVCYNVCYSSVSMHVFIYSLSFALPSPPNSYPLLLLLLFLSFLFFLLTSSFFLKVLAQ